MRGPELPRHDAVVRIEKIGQAGVRVRHCFSQACPAAFVRYHTVGHFVLPSLSCIIYLGGIHA